MTAGRERVTMFRYTTQVYSRGQVQGEGLRYGHEISMVGYSQSAHILADRDQLASVRWA
ncbi:hypothetical protein COMA1_10741 [Candidatus Nitrospira nitrosa]|uniref:Uncharacterized protein n=1 Tax=Candidatus Nitrospira nitrosa TaxID=1742972 RepID=A0A0S4L4Q1_9BACT|nr:hypothetical protein COMA1_10741 [Candidatus Nitrospira nitrosa]